MMFLMVQFSEININIWLNVLHFVTVFFIFILIILENRDPVKTMAWGMLMFLFPVGGIILYFFFGRNFRREKIFSRKEISDIQKLRDANIEQINNIDKYDFADTPEVPEKLSIIKLMLKNNKSVLTLNNHVEVLKNGEETFSKIKEELLNAQNHIHLEYYIIEEDNIGNEIKDILIKKSKEGVKVRVVYDAVGSWDLSDKYIQELKDNNVEIFPFMSVRFVKFASKVNYRNHRKIIVIDGKKGFVGGLNIADRYIKGNTNIGAWRDTHLFVEGEAVQTLQIVFMTDWFFACDVPVAYSKEYFPDYKKTVEHIPVQITAGGPDSDWASIMQAYFAAISTAKKNIYITSPYFLPNESIMTAIKTAALQGLDVKLLIPFKSDSAIAYWGSLSYVRDLLEAGVKVYLYNKGFTHSKLLMVDGVFASVGTANMDIRSFDQNFEINALVYNTKIAEKLENDFLQDIQNSIEVEYDIWINRPFRDKIKSSVSRLFSPLL